MNQLVPISSHHACPALVAAAGERAVDALPRILRGQHPQPAHAPGLCSRCGGIPGLVRERRRAVDRRRAAGARRHLDRGRRRASSPRRASSNGSPRSVTCSIGWSPARSCRSTRPHSVRGPRHVVTSGQTPVLDPAEARALLDSIDVVDASPVCAIAR